MTSPEPQVNSPEWSRPSILVVDDDYRHRVLLVSILRCHGNCIECENPLQALERAKRHRIDVAVVSADLPLCSMTGPVLAERLHSIDPTIALVLQTDHDDDPADPYEIQSAAGAVTVCPKRMTTEPEMCRLVVDAAARTLRHRTAIAAA